MGQSLSRETGTLNCLIGSATVPRRKSVALGLNGAWVVLWTDGTRSWDLRYTYPGLQNTRLLDDMKDGGIVFIALNAYQEDRYFLTKEDGSCTYSMTMSDNNESRIVNEMTNDYLKLRAKHDGASFTNTYTHNGRSVQAQISAEGIRLLNKRQQLVQMWKKRRGQLVDGRNLGLIGAVSGGSGLLARLGGAGALRAFSVGASAGFGAAIALLFRT
ncbi:hypothetical protein BDV96DRAFT_391840 [Lophiotrema nucula]|uniref:Uncharacterized protein n=1 Tax=Lophiotrema nucula TaxID=690887 RepID=A0A6A5ZGK0_9PLEO|nr:hypothetical protein BDV96DRAFT_391840 [Lophiotrema nucula]